MGVFASVPGGPTPQQIRELVVNNPRVSTLGFATLVIPAHNPAHQGMIYALHTVAKFATRLDQPATQWDNQIFSSISEVVGNQNPATIQLPADAFSRCTAAFGP
jgi:TnpA family transposase